MTKLRYIIATSALMIALLINVAALYTNTNAQAAMNRAGLVVQFKDGSVQTRCVSFSEPEISGYDLLRRARLSVVADIAGGGSICKIGDTGCNFPSQPCFCECQDLNQTCIYWMYYFQADGAWKYSSLGAGLQKVSNGSVNGWAYGAGSASSGGAMPPLMTFDQICAETQTQPQPTDPPAAAPQPTATPAPAPTSEPTIAPAESTAPPATATTSASRTVPAATMTIAPQASATTALTPEAPLATGTSTSTAAVIAAAQTTPTPAASTATAEPSVTSASTVTASNTASTVTTAPTTTPVDEASGQTASNNTGYLCFGGIVVTLAATMLVIRRRSGGAIPG